MLEVVDEERIRFHPVTEESLRFAVEAPDLDLAERRFNDLIQGNLRRGRNSLPEPD